MHETVNTWRPDGRSVEQCGRMLVRLGTAAAFLACVAIAQPRFPSAPPNYSTAAEAAAATAYLQSHPDDRAVLKRLLDYYEAHWQEAASERARLILWTIEHHPGIDLDSPNDPRALLVNPDHKQVYAEARQLWLRQVRTHPDDARVLENAAICLRLTDREAAAGWLKRAMALKPDRRSALVFALADVYAAAISGESGMNPWEGPTSVDASETTSEFARRARTEAAADAEMAARTGWALYLATEGFHRLQVSDADYDAIAEQLLLKAAAFDYPKPARMSLLGTFYARQEGKKSGQIYPKSRIVAVPPQEQSKRLLTSTTSSIVTGEKNVVGPVHITVDVIIGTTYGKRSLRTLPRS